LRGDWTGQIRLKRFDKSDFWRTSGAAGFAPRAVRQSES
jgi:hypothetical protein